MKNYSYRRPLINRILSRLDYGHFLVVSVTSILLVLAVVVAGVPGGIGKGYSSGARTGTITKLSYKGIFIKSYEGEMNMGGLRKKSNGNGNITTVANTFSFSVNDPETVKIIEAALDSGEPIKLSYDAYLVKPFGFETPFLITKADIKH